MNLVIDEGNTLCKCAWFEDGQLLRQELLGKDKVFSQKFWQDIDADNILLSTVKRTREEFFEWLGTTKKEVLFLDYRSKLPITLKYKTPQTLGNDRIAGAVAANAQFPGQNVLVIDAGTCITYDFVSEENAFLGGGISPGIHLRFKALHNYTARLPLVQHIPEKTPLVGRSTEESMLSGVINGVKAEVHALIEQYRNNYQGLKVIISGGDALLFETNPKNNIFAQPNLVLHGLNKILSHNAPL
ncbi:MAG: type III pantothenate kinase [Chitinophagales bacterium]